MILLYPILTFTWLRVLHMFYTRPSNTIVLTPQYIVLFVKSCIAPNGSLLVWWGNAIIEKYKTSHFETISDAMFYIRFTVVKKWCKTSKTSYDNNKDYI